MGTKIVLIGLTVFLAAFSFAEPREITGFEIPEYDEENNLESLLSGEKARFGDTSEVVIDGLKIETFKDEVVEMTVTAPHCIYNRQEKTVKSDSRIRIEREEMVITGKDFEYNAGKELFKINKDVKVVLANRNLNIEAGGE
ncbi:MAG: LPS export ABC transporter periplasmic protein LptC [Desulfatiglandaceae bacterium]